MRRGVFTALLALGPVAGCDRNDVEPSTEAFCAAHAAIGASAFGTNTSADPAAVEQAMAEAAPLFDDLAATAPGAIASEAAAVEDAFDRLATYLAEVGHAPPAETPADVTDALATVTASAYDGSPVGAFVEDNCGLDLEPGPG